jgi:hypothetical protein
LAGSLEPAKLYSPTAIAAIGLATKLYPSKNDRHYIQDLQRLTILPTVGQWPAQGFGMVRDGQQRAVPAWPGHMWTRAILQTENEKLIPWRPVEHAAYATLTA